MKKSIKILIVVLCLIIVGLVTFIVVDKVLNAKKEDKTNNESNNTTLINEVKDENQTSNSNSKIKKLDITVDQKLNILCYSSKDEFSTINDLSNDEMIYLAAMAIWRDYVGNIPSNECNEENGYSKEYINQIVYSIFGVEVKEHKSIECVTYKNGYYYINWGDGDPIPAASNVEKSNENNISYYTHDIIAFGNVGTYYYGEKYKVAFDSNGFVQSRKCISNKVFDDIESMKFESSNEPNEINAIVAILKYGENKFITEQKDGYYIYVDDFGNRYEIKEITGISVALDMDILTSKNDDAYLYYCTLNYIDKDGKNINSEGYINNIEIALLLSKDNKNYSIHAPYDDYLGTTSFSRNFSDNYMSSNNNSSDYAKEYIKIIDKYEAEYPENNITCDLIYFNNDNIPDLVIGISGYWVSLYMYENGTVYTLMDKEAYGVGGSKYYEYLEKKGAIYNYGNGYAGAIGEITLYILNSKKEFDVLSYIYEGATLESTNSMYEQVQKELAETEGYYYNGQKISEQEFNNKLKEFSVSIDEKDYKGLGENRAATEIKKQLQQ